MDLSSLPAGSGPGGRIIAADVKEFAAAAPARASAAAAAPAAAAEGGFSDTPQSGMRRVIAARLTASKQAVPHYYLTSELCLDALLAARAQLNAELPPEAKLSVNDFLIKACAVACKKVPEVNSSWLGDVIRTYDYVDVSVAVAVPSGLITPIVRDAHAKGLTAISRCAPPHPPSPPPPPRRARALPFSHAPPRPHTTKNAPPAATSSRS